MTKLEFEAILTIKLQDILSFIKDKNGSYRQSLRILYQSNIYKMLIVEELKYWQMNTPALYEMLEKENHDYTK